MRILYFFVAVFINSYVYAASLSRICQLKKPCVWDCSNRNFTKIPELFRSNNVTVCVEELNLCSNRIESIEKDSFIGLTNLRILRLCDNRIRSISEYGFRNLYNLRAVHLDFNKLIEIPMRSFSPLYKLEVLNLDGNPVQVIRTNSFRSIAKLKILTFKGCNVSFIEEHSFRGLERTLHSLNLTGNKLTSVPSRQIKKLANLRFLDLTNNLITSVEKDSFLGLWALLEIRLCDDPSYQRPEIIINKRAFRFMKSLKKLRLHFDKCKLSEFPDLEGTNRLREICVRGISKDVIIPETFCRQKTLLRKISIGSCSIPVFPTLNGCTKLNTIDLYGNDIDYIAKNSFTGLELIEKIDIINNKVSSIHRDVFSNLPSLVELDLSEIPLRDFPNLNGTISLRILKLQNCKLKYIPEYFCHDLQSLMTLDLAFNKIEKLPILSQCKLLEVIDLYENEISSIHKQFDELENLEILNLSDNHIEEIGSEVFKSTVSMTTLFLKHNIISFIHRNAFVRIRNLEYLDVSYNNLREFPTKGLKSLVIVKAKGNKNLLTFPTQEELPHAKILELVYHYHCCFFMKRVQQIRHEYSARSLTSNSKWTKISNNSYEKRTTFKSSNQTNNEREIGMQNIEPWLQFLNNKTKLYFTAPIRNEKDIVSEVTKSFLDLDKNASCTPTPNDFYPCEDLMGRQWLRVCVWIVFLLALLGNVCVLFVLTSNFGKLDVQQYLIVNLAFADLCLGIYLGFLAFVDIITLGDFRLHALEWQFSGSCKAAGFLAVFASELSVYTLTVITIERFITIKHSMHIQKRINKIRLS